MTAAAPADPYVRGCAWPGNDDLPYPRADPSDLDRLPGDTVASARLPVGVRLEFVGSAEVVELDYETRTDDLGYRGDGAGTSFTMVSGDVVVDFPARLGPGTVRIDLDAVDDRDPDEPVLVYLPEGMRPIVRAVRTFGGSLEPAPPRPRWLAYGDSIAEGWIAAGPVTAWPAIAGRRFGLDTVNLGYAGAARGETVSAEHLAALDAAVISVSHGTNCWSRIPFSVALFRAQTGAFLDVVRQGHPDTPIVVTSPILRPDAERTPNRLGATLGDLRATMEDLVQERIATGDAALTLVSGRGLIGPGDLPDGIHPGDAGHEILAEAFGGAVSRGADDGLIPADLRSAAMTTISQAFDLSGRVGIVTGAGRGLGRAISSRLAEAGATVVCADIVEATAVETASLITGAGGRATAAALDVTRRVDVDALVTATVAEHGHLDVMVNNAAIIVDGLVLDTPEEDLDRVLAVNFKGVFFGCQAAGRVMVEQRGGCIINMASGAIDMPTPSLVCYATAKAAVAQLSRTLAMELAPHQVRVNAIAPGWIDTPMNERHSRRPDGTLDLDKQREYIEMRSKLSPMGIPGEPDDIAFAALYLASPAAKFVTGIVMRPNGGSTMPW